MAADTTDPVGEKTAEKTGAKKAGAKKYVPKPEGLNLEFHQACVSSGLLQLQRCTQCGEHRHPPRWYCPSCHAKEYEFAPVSGRGQIYSMAINHFTVDPGWVGDLPYVTAVVQVDEGPRIVGALLRSDGSPAKPGDANLGDEVQITIEPRGDDFAFLWVSLV